MNQTEVYDELLYFDFSTMQVTGYLNRVYDYLFSNLNLNVDSFSKYYDDLDAINTIYNNIHYKICSCGKQRIIGYSQKTRRR